jgi:YVTN family beta-propeller protein
LNVILSAQEAAMEYRILGPLEVLDDGRQLALGGTRQRALLASLLLHANEVVSTDRLVEDVWGENPPETGPKALQVAVSQLRKTLQPSADGRLATRAPGYVLQVEPGELDRDRFERLVAEGARERDAEKRAASLREALALWRGPPLADLAYESFAQPAIAHLEEERLAALEERIDADLEAGRDAALVGELEALVARFPLRERLRGQLMLALYRSGRQADALDVYQDARRTLVEDLGVEPGPELQVLQKAILDHDPALGGVRKPRAPSSPKEAPARRMRVGLLALAGLLLLAGVVGAFLLIGGGASGHVTVPPNSVAVIDPGSNEVVEAIPVGESPGPIETQEDALWLISTNDDALYRIDAETRDVTGVWGTSGGNSPSIEATNGTIVWVGTVESTEVEIAYSAEEDGPSAYDWDIGIGEPSTSGVAALGFDGDSLLVADRGGVLVSDEYSPVALPHSPVALVADDEGYAWIANQGYTVSRVDPESGDITDVEVGDRPTAIALGEGSVWVANGSDGTVSRITPRPLAVTATIDVGRDPTAVAVGEGAVWVTNGLDGTVSRIDPETNRLVETIEVGHRPLGVAVGNGLVWVTVRS